MCEGIYLCDMTNPEFYQQPTRPTAQPAETSIQPIPIPQKIGPYKVETLLEKGGMSILYLGTHPETHQPTTIKVLSPKFVSNPEIVDRFLKEAEIIALADHPNIVKLFGQGKWEGGLYIAMEFIQGISLRQYILQTPISLKRALELLIDIGYALCHLHTHGVIHRDLKPENILITETGAVKVIDFGIAQLLTETSSDIQQQRVIGTPIYMSPEQREKPEAVSFPSDIYSLGIIAYELMLGKLSHGQIHLSLMPKGMQKILMKALQPDVKDRYLDIVDFIVDVTGYLNSDAFERDKVVKDHLSELSESLRHTQGILNPSNTPSWEDIEIEIGISSSHTISGLYYEFLEVRPGVYAIAIAESSLKSSEGMMICSIFRGMLHALYKTSSNIPALAKELNQYMCQDGLDKSFNFNYLQIDSHKKEAQYLLCGKSYLWLGIDNKNPFKTICENPALGMHKENPFQMQQIEWGKETFFILSNMRQEISENELQEIWQSTEVSNPQIWTEIFIRKFRKIHKILPEKTITFIKVAPKKQYPN